MIFRKLDILSRSSTEFFHRPVTAGPSIKDNQFSPQPPTSPYKRAWGSGAPSPLVNKKFSPKFHYLTSYMQIGSSIKCRSIP